MPTQGTPTTLEPMVLPCQRNQFHGVYRVPTVVWDLRTHYKKHHSFVVGLFYG